MFLWAVVFACVSCATRAQPISLNTDEAFKSIVLYPVVKIPEQYPLTSEQEFYDSVPNSFPYIFEYRNPITNEESVTKASAMPICGQVLSPGYAVYVLRDPRKVQRAFTKSKSKPEYHNVPFSTYPEQPTLPEIATCNPYTDASCDTCNGESSMFIAKLVVRHPETKRPGDPLGVFPPLNGEKIIFSMECLLILQTDCGVRQCGNGMYASDFLNQNSMGYVTSKVRCVPCKPGTWLTCPEDGTCTYNIPNSRGDPFIGGTSVYSPSGQTPVGGCFSCESAGTGKCHYSKNRGGACILYAANDPLPWYCPGGASAPVVCGPGFFGSDANHTRCVCSPGSFQDGQNGCSPCPRGFQCRGGFMEECPDHTYQDSIGQTACYRCTSDGTSAGAPLASCPVNQVLRRCTGRYKAEPPLCVPCNMCVRDYVSSPAGRVDCY